MNDRRTSLPDASVFLRLFSSAAVRSASEVISISPDALGLETLGEYMAESA